MNGIASSPADPFAPDFLMDPYPAYEALRALGPAFALERYGVWAMAGYAEVEPALKDWKTFISGEGVGLRDEPGPAKAADAPDRSSRPRQGPPRARPHPVPGCRAATARDVSEGSGEEGFGADRQGHVRCRHRSRRGLPDEGFSGCDWHPAGRPRQAAGLEHVRVRQLWPGERNVGGVTTSRPRGAELDHGMLCARCVATGRARHDDLPGG